VPVATGSGADVAQELGEHPAGHVCSKAIWNRESTGFAHYSEYGWGLTASDAPGPATLKSTGSKECFSTTLQEALRLVRMTALFHPGRWCWIGGYAGAAVARGMFEHGLAGGLSALIPGKWFLTLTFIVIAPLIGLIAAFITMIVVYWLFRKSTPSHMDSWFRRLQLVSAAALSFSHGTNDAQKTMGIVTEMLVTAKIIHEFKVPVWVILAAHAAIALGTFFGGWRIVHTMGKRLTKLKPRTGFCAETGAAAAILRSNSRIDSCNLTNAFAARFLSSSARSSFFLATVETRSSTAFPTSPSAASM
jgi:Phosphate transporter family